MKNIIVLYHEDCPDGFGAAWAAWRKFGNKAEYIGIDAAEIPFKKLNKKDVYFLDAGPDNEANLNKVLKAARRMVFIDHHISREKVIKMSPEYVYDAGHSASFLTWKYFYPEKKIPRLILHIQDLDLWELEMPFTKEAIYSLKIYDYDFKIWDKIMHDFENSTKRKKYIEAGKTILGFNEKTMEVILKDAKEVVFCGHKALVVNSPILGSEMGNFIAQKKRYPIGIIWSYNGKQIYVQLRSWNKVDVSKLAKRFGGGGHKRAAGFYLKKMIRFPWKEIKNA